MITLEVDDYAIVQGAKKKRLIKVVRKKGETYSGILSNKEAAFPETMQKIDFTAIEILSGLGSHPEFGISYGVKVEPFKRHITIPDLGELYFFRKVTKQERLVIEKTFNRISKNFARDKIKFGKQVDLLIKMPRGNMAGFYRHAKKQDAIDELVLCCPEFNPKELYELALHEAGHGIYLTIMDPHWRSLWVKSYTRNVTLTKIDTDRIKQLRKSLCEVGRCSALIKDLDDDDKQAFKECMRYMRRTYALQARHIDNLLQDSDDLIEYWPKNSVDVQRKTVLITEYSTKSVDEFFSEAFCLYYSKSKPLPKSINKLMDKTMAAIKAGMGNSGDDHAVEVDD